MTTTTMFELTRGGRDAVRDHGLVATDEAHLAAVAQAVQATVAELEERPAAVAREEDDRRVARLKASAELVPAVQLAGGRARGAALRGAAPR